MFFTGVALPLFAGIGGRSPCPDGGQLLVRVLGPIGVCRNGSETQVAKARTRAVLAMLVIHKDAVVPADAIIDALWDGQATKGARHAVQVAVSSLRSILGEGPNTRATNRLVTHPSGYMLTLGRRELDVTIAEDLAGNAAALAQGNHLEDAANCYLTAEALWRGPPFAEFLYAEFAQAEVRRLSEIHLCLVEDRVDTQLALGLHREIVPELEALVVEHPSRERLLGQLMIALHRSDRPIDAELAYARAVERLRTEYGTAPGRTVTDLANAMRSFDTNPA